MDKKQINFKLPEYLLQALEEKASKEQTSATEIVCQALTSFLKPAKASERSRTTDTAQTEEILQCQEELKQDVANNTEHIFVLSQQISRISKKLEERNFISNGKVKEVKSLRPSHLSTKPHNVTYGWGEAASTYPGWEPSANISYVLEQFRILNTDEARAAFADKWIGLCVQSLNGVLPICYRLLSIIRDKEMYKLAHWMEGNRTYHSFAHYFKYRFNKFFESWSEIEQIHKFIADFCPQEIRSKLLPVEDYSESKTSIVETVKPIDEHAKSNEEYKSQLIKVGAESPAQLLINGIKEMTTKEVVKFSGLTNNQVDRRRQRDKLPLEIEIEGVMYSIDYERRNLWLVKLKDAKAHSLESSKLLPYPEKQPQPTEIKSKLTQTALSEKLRVSRKTLKSKQTKLSESEFAEWTASKDPDGFAWVYSDELKKYHPLIN